MTLEFLVTSLIIVASPDRQLHLREGATEHVYGSIPILGKPVSDATVTYAATQWLRFMGMIAIGFPIAFSIDPSAFGATFARLGVPYRFAFAIDGGRTGATAFGAGASFCFGTMPWAASGPAASSQKRALGEAAIGEFQNLAAGLRDSQLKSAVGRLVQRRKKKMPAR